MRAKPLFGSPGTKKEDPNIVINTQNSLLWARRWSFYFNSEEENARFGFFVGVVAFTHPTPIQISSKDAPSVWSSPTEESTPTIKNSTHNIWEKWMRLASQRSRFPNNSRTPRAECGLPSSAADCGARTGPQHDPAESKKRVCRGLAAAHKMQSQLFPPTNRLGFCDCNFFLKLRSNLAAKIN